jgi:hypothetical protein
MRRRSGWLPPPSFRNREALAARGKIDNGASSGSSNEGGKAREDSRAGINRILRSVLASLSAK